MAVPVEIRVDREFSDATALKEGARVKCKPLLLKKKKKKKKKKPSDFVKTEQFLCEPVGFVAGFLGAQELTEVEAFPGAC